MAVEQKAMSREVSVAEIPTLDLNHWRFSSMREMSAMGVLQTYEARSVKSSKACSGSVSRMAYFCKAATRAASFVDIIGAPIATSIPSCVRFAPPGVANDNPFGVRGVILICRGPHRRGVEDAADYDNNFCSSALPSASVNTRLRISATISSFNT